MTTSIKRVTRSRPSYFRGQLLDETDFRDEQNYHRDALRLHHTRFHSWGVVDGLSVSLQPNNKVAVAAGLAVDTLGREIGLEESTLVDLSGFSTSEAVYITLSFEEEPGDLRQAENGEAGPARMVEYSVLSATTKPGVDAAVTLAKVQLNPAAGADPVSYAETTYASSRVARGQISYEELDPRLRSGWVRVPFKPIVLESEKSEANQPPKYLNAFRIGPTEAKCGETGAAGSMAIPVPPGATRVQRFRIAGERNEGEIEVRFIRCGWDALEDDHEISPLHSVKFDRTSSDAKPARKAGGKETGAFKYTGAVNGDLDAEYHALSIVITATKKASISLVAVEFGYPGAPLTK